MSFSAGVGNGGVNGCILHIGRRRPDAIRCGRAGQHRRDQRGPAGLVRCTQPGAIVTVEILEKLDTIAPGRLILQCTERPVRRPPALRVAPGSTIEFHCQDSSAGQLGPSSSLQDVVNLDFGRINPVSGPVYVDGAKPGDVLKVTLEGFAPKVFDGKGFGWTANIPGFGLLADQFTDPALCLWSYDPSSMDPALWGKSARIPLKPFSGTIGNAQNAASRGIPSIALSADADTTDNVNLAAPKSATVAKLSVDLIAALQAKAGTGPLLPAGLALNVNFPQVLDGAKWKFARIGSYNAYKVKFVKDLGADPVAAGYGLSQVHLPGVTLEMNTAPATEAQAEPKADSVPQDVGDCR